ncbi:transcription termination factor MTEF18, mitochondrial-like [Carex rostrata]
MFSLRNFHLYLRHSSLSPVSGSATATSIFRLFSTAIHEAPSPTSSSQFAVNYLIQSCGLSTNKATQLSRYVPHLKSPEKPDAVLQFLRQTGITEPDIIAAVSRDPRFLCLSVEKRLKPRMAELVEIGFSPSDISVLLSICPNSFSYTKLQQKIQFWMQILGSIEKLFLALKRDNFLLTRKHENYVVPNISFLQEQCSLSSGQIAQMIVWSPSLISSRHDELEVKVKRAHELCGSCTSGMFLHALVLINCLKQSTIDARLLYWKNLGFSQEEVSLMISKSPYVLRIPEKLVGRKIEFLMKEAACNMSNIIQFPAILTYSLEKRLIPRNLVRKLLGSKGISVANRTFSSFVVLNEKRFVDVFVFPYEHAIPRLHQIYLDACAGKTATLETV